MISCLCINAKNRPSVIPDTHWVKEGQKYTVTIVHNMVNQGFILGFTLREINLEELNTEYSCFKSDRFAFRKEDIPALLELMEACAGLNDFDPIKILEEQVFVEEKNKEEELVEL